MDIVRSAVLPVPHGFLGREAGDATGAPVRGAVAAAVTPGKRLVTVQQVHSADCITVAMPWSEDARPRADAIVTDRRGLALGILTADCAPILLFDAARGVIGAAHAGWKGALRGVIDATLAAMRALGARDVAAAIGPCIGRSSYEVSEAFQRDFEADDPANERFFATARPGHPHFDLEAYVAHRLAVAGVARVDALGLDTLGDPRRFFSYRRATTAGEASYGRQLSLIALP